MSGYPTSPLHVYEPEEKWTANIEEQPGKTLAETDERSNLRLLTRLGSKELAGTHKMYAAAVGADGKVYFGGRWIRDGAAGGWHGGTRRRNKPAVSGCLSATIKLHI